MGQVLRALSRDNNPNPDNSSENSSSTNPNAQQTYCKAVDIPDMSETAFIYCPSHQQNGQGFGQFPYGTVEYKASMNVVEQCENAGPNNLRHTNFKMPECSDIIQ